MIQLITYEMIELKVKIYMEVIFNHLSEKMKLKMRRKQVKKKKTRRGKEVKWKNFSVMMIHEITFKLKNRIQRMIENITLSICFIHLKHYILVY